MICHRCSATHGFSECTDTECPMINQKEGITMSTYKPITGHDDPPPYNRVLSDPVAKSRSQIAYERARSRYPTDNEGIPHKPWDEISANGRATWEAMYPPNPLDARDAATRAVVEAARVVAAENKLVDRFVSPAMQALRRALEQLGDGT